MAEVPIIREGDWVGLNRSIRKLASLVSRQTESAVDSAITSTAVVLSDATSDVQSAVDSLETLASDTLESLHTYESALSDSISELKTSAHSELMSQISIISNAVSVLDNDATSAQASEAIVTVTSLHIGYSKITLADGTTFSCVAFVKST